MKCSQIVKRYFIGLVLLLTISCKEKAPEIKCGCDGPAEKNVENVKGSYLGDGAMMLRITYATDKEYETFVKVCNVSDTLKISGDINALNYTYSVSGSIKKKCFDLQTLIAVPPIFAIKSIRY